MKSLHLLGAFFVISTGLGSVAQAACDSTFMPTGTRTYQSESSAGKSSMTIKTTPLSGDRVTVQSTVGGKAVDMVWTCDGSGMSASIPTGQGNAKVSFDAGFLPDTSKWKVGYSWNSNGTFNMDAPGLGSMKMSTATTSKIVSEEKVTVPAGTFTALRVDTTASVKVGLPEGVKPPPGMDLNAMMGGKTTTSSWYARGVGLIKSSSADDSYSMVLTKIGK